MRTGNALVRGRRSWWVTVVYASRSRTNVINAPEATVDSMEDTPGDRYLTRRWFLRSAGVLVLAGGGVSALASCAGSASESSQNAAPIGGGAVNLFREEGCSCCATYADYLRENGFAVDMKTVDDLKTIRDRYGIPEEAVGCHTSVVDGYVVEGHVPVEAINRVRTERPTVDGISVVGMPVSAPGMGEANGRPLDVLSFRNGTVDDYMSVTTF